MSYTGPPKLQAYYLVDRARPLYFAVHHHIRPPSPVLDISFTGKPPLVLLGTFRDSDGYDATPDQDSENQNPQGGVM